MVFPTDFSYNEARYKLLKTLGRDEMDSKHNNTIAASKEIGFGFDPSGDFFAKILVEKMLETTEYHSRQSAHEKEREELVCRLLASGMSIETMSLILKIRTDEIRFIEKDNAKNKIPEYIRTYKSRAKSRERAKKRQSELLKLSQQSL